ncbi:MAG: hypothetical protein EB051_01425 [Chlamydiia bacterium]|nr:hypothetical protein [Chlamydiia bacterium]
MDVNEIRNRVYNGAVTTGNAIINISKQGVEWGGKAVTLIRENGSAGVQKVLQFIGSAWKAVSSFFITHKDGLFNTVQTNRYALGLCGVLVAGIAIGALGTREYNRRYPTTEPVVSQLVKVDESSSDSESDDEASAAGSANPGAARRGIATLAAGLRAEAPQDEHKDSHG